MTLPGMTPYMGRQRVWKMAVLSILGAGTWTVPSDWNSDTNKIECLGAGGSGATSGSSLYGGGGGGGGYSASSNLMLVPGATVNYFVGAGGIGDTTNGASGQDTFFGATTFAASLVGAKGGSLGQNHSAGGTGGPGGLASAGIGQIKFNGGAGSTRVASGGYCGAGGGAAGPHGAGSDAPTPSNGTGGQGDNGFGGLGGLPTSATYRTQDGHGSLSWNDRVGSGGGAGSSNANMYALLGAMGGRYGGGGASGITANAGRVAGGRGGDGVICVTWLGYSSVILPRAFWKNDFSQYSAGVAPSDWTKRLNPTTFTATIENVSGSISGKALRYTCSTFARRFISWDAVPLITDCEILLRFRCTTANSATNDFIAAGHRVSGTETTTNGYVSAESYQAAAPNAIGYHGRWVNGTAGQLTNTSVIGAGQDYAINQWYWLRSRVFGTSIQMSAWRDGGMEPQMGANQLHINNTDASVTTAGWVGLNDSDAAAVPKTIEIDYFAVDTSGATIPVPI